jgi:Na+/alanine symporter
MQPLGYVAIAFLVLLAGGAVTLGTGLVQLRGLVGGLKATGSDRMLRRGLVASSVGMGSVAGAGLALAAGGPGALLWMWVATLLGMALTYAEVVASVRFRNTDQKEVGPVVYMREGLGGAGKTLAMLFALVMPATAIAMGALFQAQQAGELMFAVADANPITVGAVLAVVAAALMFTKGPGARRALLLLAPVSVAAYVIVALVIIGAHTDALGDAFAAILGDAKAGEAMIGGAVGGSVLVAVQHGFLRGTFANESGLGTAGLSDQALESADAQSAGRAAMTVPLLNGGLLATLTGLAILVSGTQSRLEITERHETTGNPLLTALEVPQARGLIPSLEKGQVVVLPEDTQLEAMNRYPFVMRANPRGSKVGTFDANKNAIAIPVWRITENVDTIVFRSADELRRLNPAYDLRIPVTQEPRTLANGVESLVLTPLDEGLDLAKLKARMRGPYIQLEDFYFEGGVAAANHPRYGDHLAMFEDPPKDGPPNPPLRTVISFGFRGPYFYESGEQGRPPSALVSVEGFEAPVGRMLTLRMEPPARGSHLGSVVEGTGEYRTPGWDFLQGTKLAVLRHVEDPAKDLRVPVDHYVAEDGTLRFTSAATDIVDFAKAAQMKEFTGPFLLPPAYAFEVEVHSSARLDQKWSDRVSLVPVHPHPEPQGGTGEIYTPHPGELFLTDMQGPFMARQGAVLMADAAAAGLGDSGPMVLAAIALILALTTAVTWAAGGARVLSHLLGSGADLALKVAFLVALVVGATATLDTVLGVAEPLMLATLALNVVALLMLLPKILSKN